MRRTRPMNASLEPDLVGELTACLARVRDHIYAANTGGLIVATACHLFEEEAGRAAATSPAAIRPHSSASAPETAAGGEG